MPEIYFLDAYVNDVAARDQEMARIVLIRVLRIATQCMQFHELQLTKEKIEVGYHKKTNLITYKTVANN